MKNARKQVVLGIASGAAAIAAAIAVAHLGGVQIPSSSAAAPPSAPAPVAIPPSNTSVGFSSLGSARLSTPPDRVVSQLQSMHPGAYASARQIGDGMFIAENNGAVCMWVDRGLGGCTDRLNAPDAWIAGDMIREYDSETAPFQVHLYGIARDSVASFSFTLADGATVNAPVTDNAFSVTLRNTTFADVTSIAETYGNGRVVKLDPSVYYPQTIPTVKP